MFKRIISFIPRQRVARAENRSKRHCRSGENVRHQCPAANSTIGLCLRHSFGIVRWFQWMIRSLSIGCIVHHLSVSLRSSVIQNCDSKCHVRSRLTRTFISKTWWFYRSSKKSSKVIGTTRKNLEDSLEQAWHFHSFGWHSVFSGHHQRAKGRSLLQLMNPIACTSLMGTILKTVLAQRYGN